MDLETTVVAGRRVTRLVLGTLTMSPLQANLGLEAGGALVAQAVREGVTWIDTAQMYGSYGQVKRGLELAGSPDLFVSTKSTAGTEEKMRQAFEEAQRELGRERLDVFLLHAVRSAEDLERRRPALGYLEAMKAEGKLGAIGLSSHSVQFSKVAAEDPRFEVLHLIVNRDGVGCTDGTPAEMEDALCRARARGAAVYAMKPLGGGFLRGDAEAALAWARDHARLDAVAVGATSAAELEMNLRVFRREPVPEALRQRAGAVPKRTLVNPTLCDGCGKCEAFCEQHAVRVVEGKARVEASACIVCAYCLPECPKFALRIV